MAVSHRQEEARAGLFRREADLLRRIASGRDIAPTKIRPRMIRVRPDSEDELLFRYAALHWSIPVSSGYGRRLRFLVIDEHNNKLIGLIGLGDPIYGLAARDAWIGWTSRDRKVRIANVMDAFVLGAVPPYSYLLCGKLVAMLAASDTVRNAFKRKYGGVRSLIRRSVHDGRLALITTTSALGRSSVYNRLRIGERYIYESVGYTKGSGEFHFSNGIYKAISEFAEDNRKPTAKQERWGIGFRNRREVIRKTLPAIGLSGDWIYHGIEREVFVVPLARNTREFLCRKDAHLKWHSLSVSEIFRRFRERWLLPRFAWDKRYREWSKEDWVIWKTANQQKNG
jgi:hypothetical protein